MVDEFETVKNVNGKAAIRKHEEEDIIDRKRVARSRIP